MTDFVFAKKFQKPIQLPDTHPFDQINALREDRIGLASEGGRNYLLYARFSRCVSQQSRINTVSGDDSQGIVTRHSERSEAESKNPALKPKGNATGFLDFARNDGTSFTRGGDV
jgi:hypothetical protein